MEIIFKKIRWYLPRLSPSKVYKEDYIVPDFIGPDVRFASLLRNRRPSAPAKTVIENLRT